MSVTHWGKPIYTADNSSSAPGVYQSFSFAEHRSVAVMRVDLIQYNNPTYTSVQLQIYGKRGTTPIGKLLYTSSNTVTKTTIGEGVSNAWKNIYFTFSPYAVFRAGDLYYAALFINGAYVGDATSHLAWKNGYPNPINTTGLTITANKQFSSPLDLCVLSSKVVP